MQSVQALLRTSDKIEQSKKTMYESEEVARNVLVDLELQRSQLQDMKGMVHETSSITGEVRSLLQKIADRSYRRKVLYYMLCLPTARCVYDDTHCVYYALMYLRRCFCGLSLSAWRSPTSWCSTCCSYAAVESNNTTNPSSVRM